MAFFEALDIPRILFAIRSDVWNGDRGSLGRSSHRLAIPRLLEHLRLLLLLNQEVEQLLSIDHSHLLFSFAGLLEAYIVLVRRPISASIHTLIVNLRLDLPLPGAHSRFQFFILPVHWVIRKGHQIHLRLNDWLALPQLLRVQGTTLKRNK